jgi:hypothetical protein
VPEPPARRKRRGRAVLIVALVAGLAGLGGGGAALFAELTRPPTTAEVAAASQAEIASRWQRLPAGQIFPPAIRYTTSAGAATTALRVGIAPKASCTAALDLRVVNAFLGHGCVAVLRATYLDESGTLAATIGIAVMPSVAAAQAVANAMPGNAGIRVPRFPGTRAALFGDAQRDFAITARVQGPYVFLFAAGATDGRSWADQTTGAPVDLGNGIVAQELNIITGGPLACSRRDIRC